VFTAVVVLSLALGIGANAAIFGAINGLLLKPLPVAAPDRLVAIFTSDFSGPTYGGSSYADAVDFAAGAPALSGVATSGMVPISVTIGAQPERVFAELVSPDYFDVLGLRGTAGRLPTGSLVDGTIAPAVVITHRFWQRRFAGDPGVIGRAIRVGREAATIVAVGPPDYAGLTRGLDLDLFVVEPVGPARLAERGNDSSRGLQPTVMPNTFRRGATIDPGPMKFSNVAPRRGMIARNRGLKPTATVNRRSATPRRVLFSFVNIPSLHALRMPG